MQLQLQISSKQKKKHLIIFCANFNANKVNQNKIREVLVPST